MEKVFCRIVNKLEENGSIEAEDKEVYIYALNMIQVYITNFAISAAIGIALGMFWYCMVFLIAFMILRQEAGGYHARGWKACYFLSTLILVVALIWIKIQFTWKIYITAALSIISAIYIFIFAPLADENKPLDERDRKAIRKRAHKIVIFETLTGILLLPFQDMLACAVLSSVILSGGTYIVWFIREKRKNLNILEKHKRQ